MRGEGACGGTGRQTPGLLVPCGAKVHLAASSFLLPLTLLEVVKIELSHISIHFTISGWVSYDPH